MMGKSGYYVFEPSPAAKKLQALRQRAGVSVRDMATALGMPKGSSYQHYENRYQKPYLPADLAQKIADVLAPRGIPRGEVLELAGMSVDIPTFARGKLPTNNHYEIKISGNVGPKELGELMCHIRRQKKRLEKH